MADGLKKRKGTKFTEEEIELFIYLFDRNVKVDDLAKFFNKDSSNCHRTITKLGLKRKSAYDFAKEFFEEKERKNERKLDTGSNSFDK